jgi:hypothetical protein
MKEGFERSKASNDNQSVEAKASHHIEKATSAIEKLEALFVEDSSEKLFYRILKYEAFEHIKKLTIPADENDPRFQLLKRFNKVQELGREKGFD